jgi:hypothetical protein
MKIPEEIRMRKTVPFWAVAIAVFLFVCGDIAFSARAFAAQNLTAPPPAQAERIRNGPRFLVRLDQEMNTGREKLNQRFEVKTLEPLETASGYTIPPGAKITGHISRIEPAGLTGRARLWLTFDDIQTRRGTLPIVAEVSSVPGEYSVRAGESREGEIEARGGKSAQVAEATAGGAAIGSVAGISAHNSKAAARGAAEGGVAAFLASSGLGQELDLPKGTKLELVLDRPLYLTP